MQKQIDQMTLKYNEMVNMNPDESLNDTNQQVDEDSDDSRPDSPPPVIDSCSSVKN